jgi:hypothetical protein
MEKTKCFISVRQTQKGDWLIFRPQRHQLGMGVKKTSRQRLGMLQVISTGGPIPRKKPWPLPRPLWKKAPTSIMNGN